MIIRIEIFFKVSEIVKEFDLEIQKKNFLNNIILIN